MLLGSREWTELFHDLTERTVDEGATVRAAAPQDSNEFDAVAARDLEYSRSAVTAAYSRRDERLAE